MRQQQGCGASDGAGGGVWQSTVRSLCLCLQEEAEGWWRHGVRGMVWMAVGGRALWWLWLWWWEVDDNRWLQVLARAGVYRAGSEP
jgi:hypothetical protein